MLRKSGRVRRRGGPLAPRPRRSRSQIRVASAPGDCVCVLFSSCAVSAVLVLRCLHGSDMHFANRMRLRFCKQTGKDAIFFVVRYTVNDVASESSASLDHCVGQEFRFFRVVALMELVFSSTRGSLGAEVRQGVPYHFFARREGCLCEMRAAGFVQFLGCWGAGGTIQFQLATVWSDSGGGL